MKKKRNQKGQVAIEYLLMTVVAITLGLTFKKRMEEFFFQNPNSFIAKSLRNYKSLFAGDRRYKSFPVVQARRNR